MYLFNALLATVLLLSPFALAVEGPGPCHPYPGAAANDCLKLIGQNLNNSDQIPCVNGRATLRDSSYACSIVVACASGQTAAETDTTVRRALTTIGSCSLNDYGSISGYYVAEDGSKTCYLYPSKESDCQL